MNTYSLLVFIHVLGGVGIYVALGIEAIALGRLQRAESLRDASAWLQLLALAGRLAPSSMLAALASGVWMAVQVWGHQPWIFSAFLGLVAMGIAGGAISGRRLRRLRAALPFERGPEPSSAFLAARSSAALQASLRVRIAIGLGVLALMTLKPDAAGSAVILSAAILAGFVASISPVARRSRLAGTSA
jgi:hypothetical protein